MADRSKCVYYRRKGEMSGFSSLRWYHTGRLEIGGLVADAAEAFVLAVTLWSLLFTHN